MFRSITKFVSLNNKQTLIKRNIHVQYISDLHIDIKPNIPNIIPKSDLLCICGDIGLPTHPHYDQLLFDVKNKFEKVFIVAGNHEYDCSCLYEEDLVNKYKPILVDLCKQYDNVFLLDNTVHQITPTTIIAGTTLWTNLQYILNKYPNDPRYNEHIAEFNKNLEWIKSVLETNHDVLMMTHFVPTFELIEPHYLSRGLGATNWFASDLDSIIKDPIIGWICGHTHSILEKKINGIYCGVNALGNFSLEPAYKFVEIE